MSAYLAVRAARHDEARRLLAGAVDGGKPRWVLPDPTERPELSSLVGLLPTALPLGETERSETLLRVLAAHGTAEQVAGYGVSLYGTTHDAEVLYVVAGGLARCGNADEAMAWLQRAVQDRPDVHRLATDRALWPLHGRADYQQLLADARGR